MVLNISLYANNELSSAAVGVIVANWLTVDPVVSLFNTGWLLRLTQLHCTLMVNKGIVGTLAWWT